MRTDQDPVAYRYARWGKAFADRPEMPLDEWRALIESWHEITTEPEGIEYAEIDAGGVAAMWATPKGAAAERVLLCFHGGGYVTGSMHTHRKFFAHVAAQTGCRSLIVDYRRSPEHHHPAPVTDALRAYVWLLDSGISAEHVAFIGDSSGGGVVAGAMLQARTEGKHLPAAGVLLSPWLDLTASGDSHVTNDASDLLLDREFGLTMAEMFLGDGDPKDPLASPLFADLEGLPPLYVQVSDAETLFDDSRMFVERARAAGVSARLDVFPGLQHTFQIAVGNTDVADAAVASIAAWVRLRLGLGSAQ